MMTSRVEYLGNLRTKCTHLKSGTEIITDAPIDNNGKGEAFSPTDLVATSYASCMITIVGIYCNNHGIEFDKCIAEVKKVMASNPRRISELQVNLNFEGNNWNTDEQSKVIKAAEACPVAKSVHNDIEITFNYTF